jgi:autotransporter passenger strand-loop-strand repeat protein
MTNIVGLHIVSDGGVETGDVVGSGGVLFASGGTLSNTTVGSGGFELVANEVIEGEIPILFPGIAIGSVINAGGVELVFSGGVVSNTVVEAGGLEVLEGPATGFPGATEGTAVNTTVNGGLQIVFGSATGTAVDSGTEIVWSGGETTTSILNGATSFEFVVGRTFFDIINGGTEFLVSGGSTTATTVEGGGVQVVSSGSTADTTLIQFGAIQVVDFGGSAIFPVVSGTQFVDSGGTTVLADVTSGGNEVVEAGGLAIATILDGGLMEVVSGGSVGPDANGEDVIFRNGGVVQLDFSQGFNGTIAGFASPAGVTEAIDLVDITFGAGTSVKFAEAAGNTSGTLTVTDGTHVANLTLLGQYSTANFSLSSDGHGGTLITDPAVTASASIAAPQHA